MQKYTDDDYKLFAVVGVIVAFVLAIILHGIFAPTPPPPLSIEQVRAERHERFHEAGKSVNEFIRGTVGVKSKVEVETPKEELKK